MKKLFCLLLIGVAMISFVACGGSDNKDTDTQDKKPLVEENTEDKDDKENTDDEDKDKEDNNQENTNNDDKDKPTTGTGNENDKKPIVDEVDKVERVFEITTMDIDYNHVSGGEIKTVGLGVAENIKKILGAISSKYFDSKPITLTTIETLGDKKVAVIELGGDSAYWNSKFQGSTGGKITEYTLIENILQRKYEGYWINGVKFTMDGKEVKDNGHIPNLSTTSYRK
ncbi:MAG: hypothetical protein ACRDCW_18185 [Sarcina sp.]